MPTKHSPSFSVLLVDALIGRSGRLMESIRKVPAVSLLGCVSNLRQAFNITKRQQPDLVVLTADQVISGEFLSYAELLDTLRVNCLIFAETGDVPAHIKTRYPTVTKTDLQESGGLGPIIFSRYRAPVTKGNSAQAINVPSHFLRPESGRVRKTVVIGASTGGVEALLTILSRYPKDCPPTLVVQHINAGFLTGFAARLDRHCAAQVKPADPSAELTCGTVLLAPGNTEHLTITPPGRRCSLVAGDPVSGHRPSVDALFDSAAKLGEDAVGVILTGMGRDGAKGLRSIRQAGGWTIGQDEATSAVYGMPRAAHELGAVAQQLPLEKICRAILNAAAMHPKVNDIG